MDYEFTTDGCSGGMTAGWQLLFNKPPPWNHLCVVHDQCYWKGGTAADRRRADRDLLDGMVEKGYPFIGLCMWLAVRVGGNPWLPLPWRWAYGWKYPRGYQ